MNGGSDCHVMDTPPNGSKALTLLLRISTLALALTSAVVMAAAGECTINHGDDDDSITVTFRTFPPFVYLVGCNITVAVLEVAAIYLQVSKGDDGDEEAPVLPGIVLVVVDVASQVLLYSAAGAAFAAVVAYGDQITACTGDAGRFCEQVDRAKLICFGAGLAAGLAAIAKDVPLPFSVWPIS